MSLHSRPNSWVAQVDAGAASLTYGLQVNPAPLTVSVLGDDPVHGSMEFVITNPTSSPIAVTSIRFIIPVGTDASNLTPTTAGILTGVSDSNTWQVKSPAPTTSGTATYSLEPKTGSTGTIDARASVVIQIFNFQTIQAPGNTTVTVKETIGSANNFVTFQVTTFPAGFYFNGLVANVQQGSELVPIAQVATGTAVTLVWNSSVVSLSSFAIFYSTARSGQQKATPPDIGTWVSPPLTCDTVFTLVVTAAVAGGVPLTAALSTVVAVQNPDIVAGNLTSPQATLGKLDVTGAITAGTLTSGNTTITGILTAGGIAALGKVNADSLELTGALTALSVHSTGDATIDGSVNAKSGAVNAGTLGVTGKSTLADVTATALTAASVKSDSVTLYPKTQTKQGYVADVSGPVRILTDPKTTAPVALFTVAGKGSGVLSSFFDMSGPSVYTALAAISGTAAYGLTTTGTIVSKSGDAPLTELASSKGKRVVTSPLSLHPVLMFSGSGSAFGTGQVAFDPDVVEMIAGAAYEVIIAPTNMAGDGPLGPIYVMGKRPDGFAVGCKAGGGFAFDWLVIARKAKAAGSKEPEELPASLPDFPHPDGGE
jgi:hypothetical protein